MSAKEKEGLHLRDPSSLHSGGGGGGARRDSSCTLSSSSSSSSTSSSSSCSSSSSGSDEEKEEEPYLVIPRTVTVVYGPYMYQGMMDYRTARLQGMKQFLEKLDVSVTLVPSLDHVNLCRVWYLDELIYSCKITDLIYGGDGELDPACWEAAEKLDKFMKNVLKGLRERKPEVKSQQLLKKPFCPCLDELDNQSDRRGSLGLEVSWEEQSDAEGKEGEENEMYVEGCDCKPYSKLFMKALFELLST